MPFVETATSKTGLVIDRRSHTIKLTRNFDAPRAEIFEAWTNPEHVACWWDPAGEPLAACEIDLRTLEEAAGRTHMAVEIECQSAEQLDQYLRMGVDDGTAQTLDNLVAYAHRRSTVSSG